MILSPSKSLGGPDSHANPRRNPLRTRVIRVCLAPALAWLTLFLMVPLLLLVTVSFLERGDSGELTLRWTLSNYGRLAGFGELGFDSFYPRILGRTFALASLTTAGCALLALPMAFFIARLRRSLQVAALILVVIPVWTNLMIRTYAWQILLSPGSWLSRFAADLGWIDPASGLYPSSGAVLLGLISDFLPFMVLPLFASVEKIDWSLHDAARDLGATPWQALRHAVWPQIIPGLVTGSTLVLLPAAGQFVIPDLLGGAKTAMLGNLIQQQFGVSRDWPLGAALTVMTLALVACAIGLTNLLHSSPPDEMPTRTRSQSPLSSAHESP